MKAQKRLLLLFLMLGCMQFLTAQEPYRNLIFSEVRMDGQSQSYAELTNMGDRDINLAEFELGSISPWTMPWIAREDYFVMLPEKTLHPGESFLVATVFEVADSLAKYDPEAWTPFIRTSSEMKEKADLLLYPPETDWGYYPQYDIVKPGFHALEAWSGRECWYLRHHYADGISAVVDAVNASFYDPIVGSPYKSDGPSDAAGVTGATGNRILVRKFGVVQGTGDYINSWASSAGTNPDDSQWILLPLPQNNWGNPGKKEFWTLKNHGNFTITSENLTSSVIDINFAERVMTVPWGVRKYDGIIGKLDYIPGIAWTYDESTSGNNLQLNSVQNGDQLHLYAAGYVYQQEDFQIIALPPTNNDNQVIPMKKLELGIWTDFYKVTENLPTDEIYNVPFATPVDTLLKYLEKPAQASWKILFSDGIKKADVQNGDMLKVTAKNGKVKKYLIKVRDYYPGKNGLLGSITWPDVPLSIQEKYGWNGTEIPGFNPEKKSYILNLPYDYNAIPAIKAIPQDQNARIEMIRASLLNGTLAERTITIICISENGLTRVTYEIILVQEQNPENLQPLIADPFISKFIWRDQYANGFLEVVNPGNQPLDMSNYMFCWGYVNSPSGAITRLAGTGNWSQRYGKYIPGCKWVDQATWVTQPAIVIPDPSVNPVLNPGDVFVIGDIRGTGQSGYPWWASLACDIDFGHNPWGETVGDYTALQQWNGANWYLFRIDNELVRLGQKPATDPNDFTLIDVFGSGNGSCPVVGGIQMDQVFGYTRKPEIQKGNPVFKGSFGVDTETSEWTMTNRSYWGSRGYSWPNDMLMITSGLGYHSFNEITFHISTITSRYYKVNPGYSMNETIIGVVTNTTVADFLSKIIKAADEQALNVYNSAGSLLSGPDILLNGDYLEVISADGNNTTRYYLTVSDSGLSSNAVLTSPVLTISIQGNIGTISGFSFGTSLRTIINNLIVPTGATMYIINVESASVSLGIQDYSGDYKNVTATDLLYFEVVAENGYTTILYRLMPGYSKKDILVLSDYYFVDQSHSMIEGILENTTVQTLINNLLIPNSLTVQVYDKFGYPRNIGKVMCGDKLLVTSKNKNTSKLYTLSIPGVCDSQPANTVEIDKSAKIYSSTDSKIPTLIVYPNPFKEMLFFDLCWPEDADLLLDIYNITGEKISTVYNGRILALQPVRLIYRPDANTTQMIFYKMMINDKILTGKVILKE